MNHIFLNIICVFLFIIKVPKYSSNDLTQHFGTKTPYRFIENINSKPLKYEGCEPSKIWMIIRHGTRLPSKKSIQEIYKRLPILRNEIIENSLKTNVDLTEDDLEYLKKWNVFITEADEKILTQEGEYEMINLAERMQARFPQILPMDYSNTTYRFKYTATQRTEESAKYFATGLFGQRTAKSVWYPEPSHRDPVLRFYKLCNKWRVEIKKNPLAVIEQNMFINGTIIQETMKTISKKLGFERILSYDDIYTMYITCAFESSWSKKRLSPWCAAFTKETIQTLEYAEDLKYYWIDGYGYEITYKQACPAIINMVDFFKNSDDSQKAVLYFTHSGTILKLLAHLGLYNDSVPLKHNNYTQLTNRYWKVSKIDAFASNIAAVLFRCGNTKKIVILHQERPVTLPCCADSELCDFNTFLNAYNDSINDCKFEETCRL